MHGYGLVVAVSRVRALVPLKICYVEGLMQIKTVQARSPPVGVFGNEDKGCQLRYRPRHLTVVQNYEVRVQKPSHCFTL
ncbi:hypothetical protein TNCV_4459151 [Trichonephila clavipes]|nr:hypothetical protein TNCV_4459151 [Trichonephila clavipes]